MRGRTHFFNVPFVCFPPPLPPLCGASQSLRLVQGLLKLPLLVVLAHRSSSGQAGGGGFGSSGSGESSGGGGGSSRGGAPSFRRFLSSEPAVQKTSLAHFTAGSTSSMISKIFRALIPESLVRPPLSSAHTPLTCSSSFPYASSFPSSPPFPPSPCHGISGRPFPLTHVLSLSPQSGVIHDLAGGVPLIIKELCYLIKKSGFVALKPGPDVPELVMLRPPRDLASLLTSGAGGSTRTAVSMSFMVSALLDSHSLLACACIKGASVLVHDFTLATLEVFLKATGEIYNAEALAAAAAELVADELWELTTSLPQD